MKKIILTVSIILVAVICSSCTPSLPPENDCLWSVWTASEEAGFGETALFTRSCSHCGAVQEVETEPCSHLLYEDESNGEVTVTGVKNGCDCEFMYIKSSTPQGKKVTAIGESAFLDNNDIRFLYIQDGIKTIDVAAFAGCDGLLSARISNTLTVLEAQSFFDCSSLYSISLPDTLVRLNEYTFGSCSSLREIEVPEGVTTVDTGCFASCTTLKEIDLPVSVELLGKNVFSGCTALEKINMPGVKGDLRSELFGSCTSLKEFVVPEGVTAILSAAFFNCSSLEKLYLPETVDILECEQGDSPFVMCDGKKLKVYCAASAPSENWIDGYDICNYLMSEDGETTTPVRAQFIFNADF